MTFMSKTSVPSLYDVCLLVFSTALMPKQKAGFSMQLRSSSSLGPMIVVVSRMYKDDSLVVATSSEEGITLLSKDKRNVIPIHLQLFINQNGLGHSSWIAICRVLLMAVSIYLQELQAKTILKAVFVLLNNKPEDVRTLKPTISNTFFRQSPLGMKKLSKYLKRMKNPEILAFMRKSCSEIPPKVKMFGWDSEHFRKSPEMPAILDSFYLQTPRKTKLFPKNLEKFLKLSGIPVNVDLFYPKMSPVKLFANPEARLFTNPEMRLFTKDSEQFRKLPTVSVSTPDTELQNIKSYRKDHRMKFQGMCYLCHEKISAKKFFDERRFGILEKCDCMICYGCLRKETNTSGVVKGPVKCPLCSIKSNGVAASAIWVEGKDKLKFFEVLQKNKSPRIKWGWTSFHTRKNDFCTKVETIPGKCDCMICYMCLRKINVSGLGKGLVSCPCSVKSDTIAVSSYLVEGEEKRGFFDFVQEHKALKMESGWKGLPTKKNYFCTRGQTMVLVN